MFNSTLLKSFLVGSWMLVIYAATPYSPEGSRWLAGFVLAASYILCGIVLGLTDEASIEQVSKARQELSGYIEAKNLDLFSQQEKIDKAVDECKKATERVSRSISELKTLDSRRFE